MSFFALVGDGCGEVVDCDPCAASCDVRVSCSCALLDDDTCRGDSCCTSFEVPGGTFALGGEGTADDSVSAFRLDEYEVTLGRFRAYWKEYGAWREHGNPMPGAGANPSIPGSGWQAEWDAELAENEWQFDCAESAVWRNEPAEGDLLPMNCVTWFDAFAFCIWDGGRLPTDAEWEFAAAGGDEGRTFAWGEDLPDDSLVVLCGDDCATCGDDCPTLPEVGSAPEGAGRWGQLDMAGSMWEWTLDWWAESAPATCHDCANLDAGTFRSVRGASWLAKFEDLYALAAAYRGEQQTPASSGPTLGFRCARDP